MKRIAGASTGINHTNEAVRIAALGCMGAVLGSIQSSVAACELAPLLSVATTVDAPNETLPSDQHQKSGPSHNSIVDRLVTLATEGSKSERVAALETLGHTGRTEVFPFVRHLWPQPMLRVFVAALSDHDSSLRYHALLALSVLTRSPSQVRPF